MERKTGLEPATPTLARLCSTTELLPHLLNSDIIISQFCLLSSLIFSDRTDVSLGISATFDIVSYHLLRVNRKFSFSQDVHFTVSTLAVRRKVLYTILSYFASGFWKNFRNGFQGKVRQAADISPLRPAPAAPSAKKAMWNNDHLIFAFHLPRGTCSSHRSDRETLSQLSFMP